MLAMAAEAEKAGHDELGSASGAGVADGGTGHFEAGLEAGAIDGMASDAVAGGAVSEGGTGKLAGVGSGVGVLVVGDDEDERQTLDSGLVKSFVKSAR